MQITKKLIIISLWNILSNAIAANPITDTIEQYLTNDTHIHGSILIAHNEKIIFNQGYDQADYINQQQNNIHRQFLAGSITKQFTAIAILKKLYLNALATTKDPQKAILLVKEHLLLPINNFISDDDELWQSNVPAWAGKITLHQLLSHQSGLSNYTEYKSFFTTLQQQTKINEAQVIKLIINNPLDFTPGTSYKYSNTNFFILGIILSKLCNSSYTNAIQDLIIKPLAMDDSDNIPSGKKYTSFKQKYPKLAKGYVYSIDNIDLLQELTTFEEMLYTQATGSIVTTLVDLHKWNLNLHILKNVIPAELLQLATTPHANISDNWDYGYGCFITTTPDNHLVLYHSGKISGFSSNLYFIPQYNLTIAWYQNAALKIADAIKIGKEISAEQTTNARNITEYLDKKYPNITIAQEKYNNFDNKIPVTSITSIIDNIIKSLSQNNHDS